MLKSIIFREMDEGMQIQIYCIKIFVNIGCFYRLCKCIGCINASNDSFGWHIIMLCSASRLKAGFHITVTAVKRPAKVLQHRLRDCVARCRQHLRKCFHLNVALAGSRPNRMSASRIGAQT